MTRVLVISPHPDDESVGCGGTLRKHVLAGDAVHVIFLTSGEKGGHGRGEAETARIREQEARDAAAGLGLAEVEFWRGPDGALRATGPVVARLVDKLGVLSPRVIYVPHEHESHPDHRAAVRLVRQALGRVGAAGNGQPVVLMYEVWTPVQRIDHIEDITGQIDAKMKAIRTYKCQCEVLGFDDAFLGLARYRGEMHCWPEGHYAEVFKKMKRQSTVNRL